MASRMKAFTMRSNFTTSRKPPLKNKSAQYSLNMWISAILLLVSVYHGQPHFPFQFFGQLRVESDVLRFLSSAI